MKTQNISPIKSGLTTLALIIMIAFTFNSCQKDDLTSMNNEGNQNSSNSSISDAGAKMPSAGMALVKIDHMAAKSMQPDYSVTVTSNGNIVFEGRRNVKFIGRTYLLASDESMLTIKKLIANSNFLNIVVKNEFAMDAPQVTTTCTLKQQPSSEATYAYTVKSLTDINNGYPKVLYTFRTSIEKQLQIQGLIGKELND